MMMGTQVQRDMYDKRHIRGLLLLYLTQLLGMIYIRERLMLRFC